MLHILLGLLKIIGIILAVIIGIVLLIIFVVLFAAMRYEIKAAADGDVKSLDADLKFSWLFHLISGYVRYKEENLDWQVKIAWKKLNVPQKTKTIDSSDTKEVVETPKISTDNVLNEEEIVKAESIKKESFKAESVQDKEENKKTMKKVKKKKEPLGEKIRCSIQKISDKIKDINELKEKIMSYIRAEAHKIGFQKLLKELLRVLKKLKPKKLKANVEFGFEDPYTTGNILAYASMLYPIYGDNISIKPNFEEVIIKGDVYLKGRIRISYFANMGIRLILNKNIRLTIKDTMKLIAKK